MSNAVRDKKVAPIENAASEKPPMKTLANCTLVEFLRQTNKIRHAVSDLFDAVGIAEIRKNLPKLDGNETEAEKKEKLEKQVNENTSKIFDSLLDINAEATAALLAMMCFKEPREVNDYTTEEYLGASLALFQNKAVKDFLLTLVQLVLSNTDG